MIKVGKETIFFISSYIFIKIKNHINLLIPSLFITRRERNTSNKADLKKKAFTYDFDCTRIMVN